ncbi:MAG: 30S ribosomal protein S6 [Dehalococcoidia bacterium]|nr:30S ribosomal protein S6 [Dehalococcoidia bacterium]
MLLRLWVRSDCRGPGAERRRARSSRGPLIWCGASGAWGARYATLLPAEVRLNEYELLYIVHPRKGADDVPGVVEWVNGVVRQVGGEMLTADDWGRQRLAYPIQHELEGTYILVTLRLPPEATRALESQLTISEDIMRHILIRGIIPLGEDDRDAGAVSRGSEERVSAPREADSRPDAGGDSGPVAEPSPATVGAE